MFLLGEVLFRKVTHFLVRIRVDFDYAYAAIVHQGFDAVLAGMAAAHTISGQNASIGFILHLLYCLIQAQVLVWRRCGRQAQGEDHASSGIYQHGYMVTEQVRI